jgi:cytochrome c peroxidase
MAFARLRLAARNLRFPALLLAAAIALTAHADTQSTWSERDLRLLASLRLDHTPPSSPGNRVAGDPRAAALGQRIFFDRGFGESGATACATCHDPERHYTDGRARSVPPAGRNAPTVVGGAYGSWFTWDGRRDSLWAQALVPFEATGEIGGTRTGVVRRIASDAYRADYEAIFGPLPPELQGAALPVHAGPLGDDAARAAWEKIPQAQRDRIDRVYSNTGKAIEAFERTLVPADSRFDLYVDALRAGDAARAAELLDAHEVAGLRLFIDPARTQCLQCHNGPLFSNGGFHNIGTGSFDGAVLDFGRALGVQSVLLDPFNCAGPYSDAQPTDCKELRFLSRDAHVPLEGAFKTPSLRDVARTAPYFHDGRFATLRQVLDYYNAPPPNGDHELRALGLSEAELVDLERFLRALSADAEPAARQWTDMERAVLASLRLSARPGPPPDPGNRAGDDPAAAALGQALFSDPALSHNGKIACQSCHQPERAFSDGLPHSAGLAPLRRNAPTLLDVAYQRWLFWDGRADSLWSQALAPLEQPEEMGGTRTAIVRHVASDAQLAERYAAAFGPLPEVEWTALPRDAGPNGDTTARAAWRALPEAQRAGLTRAFANLGRALAAYQRTLRSRPARFDAYVDAVLDGRTREAEHLLDAREVSGLALFLSGRSNCLSCHHGPLFSDGHFHNIGTGELGTPDEDLGRARGRELVHSAEFNCQSAFRDPPPAADCAPIEGGFGSEVPALQRGAFRTPGLRNLSSTAPYLHDGRFATLEQVLEYYRRPADKAKVAHELPRALDLSDREIEDLALFLRTLDGR